MPVAYSRRRRGVAVSSVATPVAAPAVMCAVVVDAQVGRGLGLRVRAGPHGGQERQQEVERLK